MRLAGVRWGRIALAVAVGVLLSRLMVIATSDLSEVAGAQDILLYREAAQRWLDGGSFYPEWQLVGPYEVVHGAILYPPPILLLLLPFTVLPLQLWWAIPIAIVAWVIWRLRPSAWGWAGIVAALVLPNTLASVVNGNPVMWSVAALALGTLYAWPAVFAALKVSVAPAALFGCWHRSWWLAAAVAAVIALAFLPMWPDYVRALLNSSNPKGLLYSVGDVWILLLPLAAWAGRTRNGIAAPSIASRFRRDSTLPAGSARAT